jgi:hypothetical protein
MSVPEMLTAVPIGLGATLFIDLWTLFLRHAFGVRSLDYCLLGRWVLSMPHGIIRHASIARTAPRAHECRAGWAAHYSIGTVLGIVFIVLAPSGWLRRPVFWPALAFGVATVVIPFLTLQPALGLGIAASRAPSPTRARLKSLMTHAVFGVGLYAWASLLSRM